MMPMRSESRSLFSYDAGVPKMNTNPDRVGPIGPPTKLDCTNASPYQSPTPADGSAVPRFVRSYVPLV